jgi:hypothetical protein
VLRAAAEKFCARHENVDYYPSFETVTLSSRSVAYAGDYIHAQGGMVWINVARMLARYVPGVELRWDELGMRNVKASYARYIKSSLAIAYDGKRYEAAGGLIEADVGGLVGERDVLVRERDALVHERDALLQERDALRTGIEQKEETLARERQDAGAIISGLQGRVERLERELLHKFTTSMRKVGRLLTAMLKFRL